MFADSVGSALGGTFLSGVCCLAYLIPMMIGVLALVLWVVALVDVIQRTEAEFPGARQGAYNPNEKLIWLLVVILAGIIGAIVYYFVVMRPFPRMRPPVA